MKEEIDINAEFKKALEEMEESSCHLFITGRAGTGKSTLLEHFRETTQKNIVVLAPTGVAALNVGGETIHSFFRFKIGVTPSQVRKAINRDIYQSLDAIVIDEVSMVRADLLDCIDTFMRKNGKNPRLPFGGAQLIFLGDLYQLPPVVLNHEREFFHTVYDSPYFFDSHVFERMRVETIEMETVYRQQDDEFIDILDGIRSDTLSQERYTRLNSRLNAEFHYANSKYTIYLTTTNKMADDINQKRLGEVLKKEWNFPAVTEGDFEKRSFPTAHDLKLKKGAQVMMLNNDTYGRWVNGSLGEVIGIDFDYDKQCNVIGVELEDGNVEDVLPHKWEIFKYSFDQDKKKVHADPVGIFVQYPMKLAWAVTIHKSQGKTFDNVIIDIGRGTFAHGQAYVALSRCRSLEGILLKKPILPYHIKMDKRIIDFLSKTCYK